MAFCINKHTTRKQNVALPVLSIRKLSPKRSNSANPAANFPSDNKSAWVSLWEEHPNNAFGSTYNIKCLLELKDLGEQNLTPRLVCS